MEDEKEVLEPQAEEQNNSEDVAPVSEQPAEAEVAETPEGEIPAEEPRKKGLKGLIEYIKSHENLRQAVLFFLFSMICGGSQMLITLLFTQLNHLEGTVLAEAFPGFYVGAVPLFKYDSYAEFIGFLIGSVVGQVLTFVLNRKKTFNVHDHIPFRAVAYAFMAVAIIFVQTLLGGAITVACRNAYAGNNEFLKNWVFNLTGQAVGGISALIISFLCNKFLVMRKFKGSEPAEEQAEEPAAESEEIEVVADEKAE